MTDDFDRRLNPFRYDSDGNLTQAARAQDSSLRLDSFEGGRGGSSAPTLAVNAALLNSRAGQCDRVGADFEQTCGKPLGDTEHAGSGMHGFTSAGAFGALADRWKAETHYVAVGLIGTFAGDLRQSADAYTKQDQAAAGSLHR